MNKLIRLTESDLHRIVKESVNRILNEVGETLVGQDLLGGLAGRKAFNGDASYFDISAYAREKRQGDVEKQGRFAKAFHKEKDRLKKEKEKKDMLKNGNA